MGRLCRRQPQPLADPGQRALRLRLLLRCNDVSSNCPDAPDAPAYFFCSRRNLRHLRLPQPRRTAHRCRGRSHGHRPHSHRRRHARHHRRRRALSAQRAAARLLLGSESLFDPTALCRTARSTPTSARKISTSPSRLFHRPATQIRSRSARIRRPAPTVGRQPPILRRHSGPHSSSRAHSAHRRRALRFAARPQLLRLRELHRSFRTGSCNRDPSESLRARASRQARLAAAIRRHLQPRREPHALLELRRDVVARSARRHSGPTTAASFSRRSSRARPRSARSTSPASAFCSPPRFSTCARRSSIQGDRRPRRFLPDRRRRRSLLRIRGPRNARRHRAQRRRQSRKLAAPQRLGRGHERHLHRHRHALLRQQAGDQRAAPAHAMCLPISPCPACAACT